MALDRRPKLLLDALGAIRLRNRIIHGYDAVDNQTVYGTVVNDLAPRATALRA